MNLAIVYCIHGNEPYGLEVVKKLPGIPSFIGNEHALKQHKRFIDTDLNRSFPGDPLGNHEEKLAHTLRSQLTTFEYVLDLHSSSNECPLFGIITSPSKKKISFAKRLGLQRLIIMTTSVASGKALIDHVDCGISLEIGPHTREENIDEVVTHIRRLASSEHFDIPLEIYEVFKIIKKERCNILIKNFERVHKGQLIAKDHLGEQYAESDFIAILVNESAYKDILCFAAKSTISYE